MTKPITLIDPPMADLPRGRKTLLDSWWCQDIDDIPPGQTLLARHLKIEWRRKRRLGGQDQRCQRELRSRARDAFQGGDEYLWPTGSC